MLSSANGVRARGSPLAHGQHQQEMDMVQVENTMNINFLTQTLL
jgi:hypothetical protein